MRRIEDDISSKSSVVEGTVAQRNREMIKIALSFLATDISKSDGSSFFLNATHEDVLENHSRIVEERNGLRNRILSVRRKPESERMTLNAMLALTLAQEV